MPLNNDNGLINVDLKDRLPENQNQTSKIGWKKIGIITAGVALASSLVVTKYIESNNSNNDKNKTTELANEYYKEAIRLTNGDPHETRKKLQNWFQDAFDEEQLLAVVEARKLLEKEYRECFGIEKTEWYRNGNVNSFTYEFKKQEDEPCTVAGIEYDPNKKEEETGLAGLF